MNAIKRLAKMNCKLSLGLALTISFCVCAQSSPFYIGVSYYSEVAGTQLTEDITKMKDIGADRLGEEFGSEPGVDLTDSMTASGIIALQVHGIGKDEKKAGLNVSFRNLKIRNLPAK